MIHVVTGRATPEQIQEMLVQFDAFIKVAVDVRQRTIAGGGGMHADCEDALLQSGSRQEDVWGANWYPEGQEVEFESLINIRPRQGNRSMLIADQKLRDTIAAITRERFTAS